MTSRLNASCLPIIIEENTKLYNVISHVILHSSYMNIFVMVILLLEPALSHDKSNIMYSTSNIN